MSFLKEMVKKNEISEQERHLLETLRTGAIAVRMEALLLEAFTHDFAELIPPILGDGIIIDADIDKVGPNPNIHSNKGYIVFYHRNKIFRMEYSIDKSSVSRLLNGQKPEEGNTYGKWRYNSGQVFDSWNPEGLINKLKESFDLSETNIPNQVKSFLVQSSSDEDRTITEAIVFSVDSPCIKFHDDYHFRSYTLEMLRAKLRAAFNELFGWCEINFDFET